jgi:hypothetical protein
MMANPFPASRQGFDFGEAVTPAPSPRFDCVALSANGKATRSLDIILQILKRLIHLEALNILVSTISYIGTCN